MKTSIGEFMRDLTLIGLVIVVLIILMCMVLMNVERSTLTKQDQLRRESLEKRVELIEKALILK